jgi:hypothetical protein
VQSANTFALKTVVMRVTTTVQVQCGMDTTYMITVPCSMLLTVLLSPPKNLRSPRSQTCKPKSVVCIPTAKPRHHVRHSISYGYYNSIIWIPYTILATLAFSMEAPCDIRTVVHCALPLLHARIRGVSPPYQHDTHFIIQLTRGECTKSHACTPH